MDELPGTDIEPLKPAPREKKVKEMCEWCVNSYPKDNNPEKKIEWLTHKLFYATGRLNKLERRLVELDEKIVKKTRSRKK